MCRINWILGLIVKSHSLHFILTMVLSSVCPKILQFAIFLGKVGGKMAAGGLRSPAQQGEGVLFTFNMQQGVLRHLLSMLYNVVQCCIRY